MNNKIYKIGFFILLVMNIGLVVIVTLRPKPPIQGRGIKDEISHELMFSEEQQEVFNEMVKNHREAIRELEMEEQELMRSFFGQLSSHDPNRSRDSRLQKILQLEKDKIMVTYRHFEELKRICNDEQLIKFDNVVKQIVPILTTSSGRPVKEKRPPR